MGFLAQPFAMAWRPNIDSHLPSPVSVDTTETFDIDHILVDRGSKRRKDAHCNELENLTTDCPRKRRLPSPASLCNGQTFPIRVDSECDFDDDPDELSPELLRDLETRPITVPQLIQEVKGIYAGLVMVEKKCIEIVSQQAQSPTNLSREQWQALIALHRTLLNENHDFFSATHHPVTKNHELRKLAAKYDMPARLWRHGIHAFLELLRHRLPDSIEHMLSFVYLAYSMIGLLKETVPDFLETWIECLGDLARYRMAIEEADMRDHEIWSNTARTWYYEAADLSPKTGRIQHHLAVLARPNIVQQLFLYSKALVAAVPFRNTGESILLLFNPLHQEGGSGARHQFAELHATRTAAAALVPMKDEFHDISRRTNPNIRTQLLRTVYAMSSHIGDKNVVPFMHRLLVYILALSWIPSAYAAPVDGRELDSAQANAGGGSLSPVFNWVMPLLVLILITGGDLFVDQSRYRNASKILQAMNSNATTFWATFSPLAAAAILPLCDEKKVEHLVFMFLLGCEFNQFRRCIRGVLSPPEAFILVAALWVPSQHLLLKFAVHDLATQRVARWMIASFAITIVTKLCALCKRVWGRDSSRNYDNAHISGGFAVLGDYVTTSQPDQRYAEA